MVDYSDLNPNEWKVLWQLGKIYLSDMNCLNLNGLHYRTGLSREEVRKAAKTLRAKGLVLHQRGLFDDEGKTAGSGYAATKEGYELAEEMYRMVKE